MRILVALLAVALLAGRARADDTVAGAAFTQAIELEKQGKWAEACPLYETSYRADPQIGVLLHLAICHEQIGHFASAWTEFNDAADLARARRDPRESTARDRATALAPKLGKLYLAAPSKPIPGLVVRRDGIEVTGLIGSNMPTDPGDHEIAASAPGYVDWTTKVKVTAQNITAVDLPLLQKNPDAPAPVHEGTIVVTTQPDGEILIDTQHVGVGRYEAKLRSGGHTLRVVAPGMRAYQSEVVIGDGEERKIDVPLERLATATVIVAPTEDLPSFELGANFESGVKLKGDRPAIVALRVEVALRLGRRVNLGLFAELGTISTGNACGYSMPGAIPSTPYDFGPRNQFTSCNYVMPGLQLLIHILPKQRFDPYIGLAPGFRIGFAEYVPYSGGVAGAPQGAKFPAIVTGARAGLNYHPIPTFADWQVGAFFETAITLFGQEADDHNNTNNGANGGEHFVSLLGGLRSTVTF